MKIQPMLKAFQMKVCELMYVEECRCYIVNDGVAAAQDGFSLLGWNASSDGDGEVTTSAAAATTGELKLSPGDGDPIKTFDSLSRLMRDTVRRAAADEESGRSPAACFTSDGPNLENTHRDDGEKNSRRGIPPRNRAVCCAVSYTHLTLPTILLV